MAILGGSPLGLIGVRSTPTRDGMSTFNAGKSRNVNVNLYNAGKETDKAKMAKTNNKGNGMFSVFTGGNVVRAWPGIGTIGKDEPTLGLEGDFKGVSRRTLHNNDVYDTSILNIIEKTAGTSAALRPSDFAYLRNVGVYSNNRLIIARRFGGPMLDDIFSKGNLPLAVMIAWRPEGEDFLEMGFGEHWVDAKADFTSLLNNLATDVLTPGGGSAAGAALGTVPLPGFTEGLTRAVLTKLGVLEDGGDLLPAGNPNLIKEAKRRKTVGYGEAGSGLKCTVSIKMVVEYEQKFISGIDPTIVFQDILANAVRFGTSTSNSYGLSKTFGQKIIKWANQPSTLISDFVTAISEGIKSAKDEIINTITKEYDEKIATANEEVPDEDDEEPEQSEKDKLTEEKNKAVSEAQGLLDKLVTATGDTLKKTIKKYKVEIEGIVKALSGAPSTPWHVTIGNPLRPIFCSGDMFTDSVNVKLGPTLAFNDLPSYITIDFTLQNARAWGAQEIMAKFNSGYLRSVNMKKDSNAVELNTTVNDGNLSESNTGPSASTATASNPNAGISNNINNSGGSASVTPGSGVPATTTKENQEQPSVNTDPNSPSPPVENESIQNPAPPDNQTPTPTTPETETTTTPETPTTPETTTTDEPVTETNPSTVTQSEVFNFTIVSEDVESGFDGSIWTVSGVYSINGKEVEANGAGQSEDKAKSKAREKAKKKANK